MQGGEAPAPVLSFAEGPVRRGRMSVSLRYKFFPPSWQEGARGMVVRLRRTLTLLDTVERQGMRVGGQLAGASPAGKSQAPGRNPTWEVTEPPYRRSIWR